MTARKRPTAFVTAETAMQPGDRCATRWECLGGEVKAGRHGTVAKPLLSTDGKMLLAYRVVFDGDRFPRLVHPSDIERAKA